MNRNLYDKSQGEVLIPQNIKNHLKNSFAQAKGANETTQGYNRNRELQYQESIPYPQLKRIKNFFDTYQGKENDLPYILNGGNVMKTWVNNELTKMRHNVKQNNSPTEADDAKVKNSDYMDNSMRPSKAHKTTVNKHATSIADASVTESLRRIKELISKI